MERHRERESEVEIESGQKALQITRIKINPRLGAHKLYHSLVAVDEALSWSLQLM